MNKILILGAFAAMSGCAFQQPQTIDDARIKLTADWEAGPEGTPSPQVKAARDLYAVSSRSYEAKGFVTLPVVAPERISVGLQVLEPELLEEPRFVRGRISVNGLSAAILASLTKFERKDGLVSLEVQIGGLRTVMPTSSSSRGRVQLEFFGSTTRQLVVTVWMRTPPSEVKSAPGSSKSTGDSNKAGQTPIQNPRVYGKQFNLVQAFDFENREDSPVEVQIPRRVEGRFYQEIQRWGWKDLGCKGEIESPGIEPHRYADQFFLSDSLYLFPIDELINVEAEKSYWNPESLEVMPRVVAPGRILRVGLFAVGSEAEQWREYGPRTTRLQPKQVPGTCRARCVGWEIPRCGPYCLMERGPRCRAWEKWRDLATVTEGYEAKGSVIEFSLEPPAFKYRFGDFALHQDGEIRQVSLGEKRLEVNWEE